MTMPMQLLTLTGEAAFVLFAALALLSLKWIELADLREFDTRLTGHSPNDARALLGVLDDDPRALYLGLFRRLDTVFPILAAMMLAGWIWHLHEEISWMYLAALIAIPLTYLAARLVENARIAKMLLQGTDASDELIRATSPLTCINWSAHAISGVRLLGFWLRYRVGERAVT